MLAQAPNLQGKGERHNAGEACRSPEGGVGREDEQGLPGSIEDECGNGAEEGRGEHSGKHADPKRDHSGDASLVDQDAGHGRRLHSHDPVGGELSGAPPQDETVGVGYQKGKNKR